MITLVVPSPHSSSCVRLSSIMFFAAGWATSISRRIELPSLVMLNRYDESVSTSELHSHDIHSQNTTHRVENHLQHGLGA
jgi:hypothetical protein